MKKNIFLLTSLLFLSTFVKAQFAYIYPSILETERNLIQQDLVKWHGKSTKDCKMVHGKGGPFSAEEQTLIIDSNGTRPNYWGSSTMVKRGHRYLVGAWVKNDNARILFWFHANYNDPKERINKRIYFFSGGSRFLNDYFSEEVKERLNADPDAWHLCYRLVDIPKEQSKEPRLSMMIGTYFATGKITIANPFIIDVSDENINTNLSVNLSGDKNIKKIEVIEQGNKDVIWRKQFNTGVTKFKEEIPDTYFYRGLDRKIFEGYLLQVEYEDEKNMIFSAPKEKTAKGL